ncbi:MAG: hypothetical protein WC342_05475 [Methanoregula sp.]
MMNEVMDLIDAMKKSSGSRIPKSTVNVIPTRGRGNGGRIENRRANFFARNHILAVRVLCFGTGKPSRFHVP